MSHKTHHKAQAFTMRTALTIIAMALTIASCNDSSERVSAPSRIGVYQDHDSLHFRLVAPGQTSVSVIGDHSMWEPLELKRNADTFYISVPRIEREYLRYQYILSDGERVADPYSTIVLDPERDWLTPSYARTNNILPPYPKETASGDVSVKDLWVRPFRWTSRPDFTIRNKRNATIYELDGREMTNAGSNAIMEQKISQKIADLKALSVNAVIITPQTNDENNTVSYPLMLDKSYGLASDMKAFIDSMHNAGIGVIVRLNVWRYNLKSPFVRISHNDIGTPSAKNQWLRSATMPNGSDIAEITLATKEAYELVDTTITYWLKDFRADGILLANATNEKYSQDRIANIRHWAHTIWKIRPEAMIICEDNSADDMEAGEIAREGVLVVADASEGFAQARTRTAITSPISTLDYRHRGWWEPRAVGVFTHNPAEQDSRIARAEATIFLSIPGPKIIKSTQEGAKDSKLRHTYETLGKLRANTPIFATANYEASTDSLFKRVTLRNGDHVIISLANFGTTATKFTLEHSPSGEWKDIFTGRRFVTNSGGKDVMVESGESMMLETDY